MGELKELADEMEACWICASIGEGEITLETINNWSGRLSVLLERQAQWPSDGLSTRNPAPNAAQPAMPSGPPFNLNVGVSGPLQSVAPPQASADPIGWVFQHDETGRMTFCENDGINNPENFVRNNPRFALVSPAFAHAPVQASAVPDGWKDPTGFSAEMVKDEAENWTRRETGKEMLLNYAKFLAASPEVPK